MIGDWQRQNQLGSWPSLCVCSCSPDNMGAELPEGPWGEPSPQDVSPVLPSNSVWPSFDSLLWSMTAQAALSVLNFRAIYPWPEWGRAINSIRMAGRRVKGHYLHVSTTITSKVLTGKLNGVFGKTWFKHLPLLLLLCYLLINHRMLIPSLAIVRQLPTLWQWVPQAKCPLIENPLKK